MKMLLIVFCLMLAAALVPAQTNKSLEIVRGELGSKLDEHMQTLARGGFSGVLLFTRGGETLLAKGYGEANQAQRLPFSVNTVFDIGSLTKQFTGAALLKLEMQGKLRVTDRLRQYLNG
ncbi:MAG: serine hydrolase, partial [Blastocatellia bacterium]